MTCAAAVLGALLLGTPGLAEVLVSVFPLRSERLDAESLRQIETLLRSEAGRLPGVTVQSRGKTRRAIQRASGKSTDCSSRLPCIVQVGELCGATMLILGTAERSEATYLVELQLVDVDKERVLRRANGQISGDAARIAEGTRELAAQLVAPDDYTGTLDVRMLMPGARIIVDGLQVGTSPTEPVTGLRPGLRRLQVTLSGADDLDQTVRIRHASTTVVNAIVADGKITAEIDEESPMDVAPLPAAVLLAQKLASPAITSAAAAAPVDATAATPSEAVTTPPAALASEEEAAPFPTLMAAGIALIASGAVTGMIGVGALSAWGYALSQMNAAVDPETKGVSDPTLYNEWAQQRGLYETLGAVGGVALPLGLVVVAGGVGLLLWGAQGDEGEAPGHGVERAP